MTNEDHSDDIWFSGQVDTALVVGYTWVCTVLVNKSTIFIIAFNSEQWTSTPSNCA